MIGNAIDRVGEGIENISNWIYSKFKQPLLDIWNSIKNIPENIVEKIRIAFREMFVPTEGYFSTKIGEIETQFRNKFNMDDKSKLDDLLYLEGEEGIRDIEGIYMGQKVKFVDFSFLNGVKGTLQWIARGFMYPLLIMFHIDNIFYMVKGDRFFGRSQKIEEYRQSKRGG